MLISKPDSYIPNLTEKYKRLPIPKEVILRKGLCIPVFASSDKTCSKVRFPGPLSSTIPRTSYASRPLSRLLASDLGDKGEVHYIVKAYALLIIILSWNGDVEPGGPLCFLGGPNTEFLQPS